MVKNLLEKEDERESSRVAKFQPPITFILIFIIFFLSKTQWKWFLLILKKVNQGFKRIFNLIWFCVFRLTLIYAKVINWILEVYIILFLILFVKTRLKSRFLKCKKLYPNFLEFGIAVAVVVVIWKKLFYKKYF